MTIPVVGDGEYLGAGNTNETLRVGKSTQAVTIGDSGASSVLIGGASAAAGRNVRRFRTGAPGARSAPRFP